MFYAWKTASDFGNGLPAVDKSTSEDALVKRMFTRHKAFFVAYRLDGAWVDLSTFGPGGNTEGREVSEDRTNRYIRSRARRLEGNGQQEINQNDDLLYSNSRSPERTTSEVPTPNESAPGVSAPEVAIGETAGREQFQLNIDPAVVKALYEFLALDQETREKAINALTALSVTAEPFKSAVQVMLDDTKELTVGFAVPAPEEGPSS